MGQEGGGRIKYWPRGTGLGTWMEESIRNMWSESGAGSWECLGAVVDVAGWHYASPMHMGSAALVGDTLPQGPGSS